MNQIIWGNEIRYWIIAIATIIGGFLIFKLVITLVEKRLKKISQKTKNKVDNFIWILFDQTKIIFLLILSIFIGSKWLNLPPNVNQGINVATIIILWVQAGYWLSHIFTYWLRSKDTNLEEGEEKTTINAITLVGKVIIWSLVFVLAIDNIPNVDITALIASLGVGGIAVGLALQNILSDLFSSLTIALDKPFVIGDFISIGDFSGSVEKIGLKSTRVRAITGEEVVFSNSDLLSGRLRNYKTMNRRRVILNFGVTYDTPVEKLKIIPDIIQKVVEPKNKVTFERAHLSQLGDFSITFQLVYVVESSDFNLHMDLQQEILTEILDQFTKNNIDFAFPTQSILLENGNTQSDKNLE